MKKISAVFFASLFLLLLIPLAGCGEEKEINSYKINCVFDDENMTLSGEEEVYFYNGTDNAIKTLKFNLFPNAFREGAKFSPVALQYESKAFPNGRSYGGIEIGVITSDGEELTHVIGGADKNVLIVELLSEVFPGEGVSVKMDFTVKIPNVNHRLGYSGDLINLGNFYPILCAYDNGFYECAYFSSGDPFFSETANYEVSLTLPNEYVVASSGELKSVVNGERTSTHNYALNMARDFAFVLSKEFDVVTENAEGVTVNYYYIDDENPKEALDYAKKSLATFNELFGKYPYKTYSVVKTKFIQGGMEYPALVYVSDEVETNSFGEVIVHETAHQWWYASVGNNQIEYAFLDEGLAEYSVVLFYENHPEYGYTREQLIGIASTSYKTFCSVYDKIMGRVDTTMLRSLAEYTSEYEYVNINYIKGCLMLDNLREGIGYDKFIGGLKRYYAAYCHKIATPYDLAGIFGETSDTDGYFSSWFNGKVII